MPGMTCAWHLLKLWNLVRVGALFLMGGAGSPGNFRSPFEPWITRYGPAVSSQLHSSSKGRAFLSSSLHLVTDSSAHLSQKQPSSSRADLCIYPPRIGHEFGLFSECFLQCLCRGTALTSQQRVDRIRADVEAMPLEQVWVELGRCGSQEEGGCFRLRAVHDLNGQHFAHVCPCFRFSIDVHPMYDERRLRNELAKVRRAIDVGDLTVSAGRFSAAAASNHVTSAVSSQAAIARYLEGNVQPQKLSLIDRIFNWLS
jgi:hypothetical protein